MLYLRMRESDAMTTLTKRSHKHFQLNSAKIKRAQRALQARTETETIERPRNKDIDTELVVDLRRMLRNAGYEL